MADAAIELPCIKCGNAAVQIDLRGALAFVPSKWVLAAKGAARLSGSAIDTTAPGFGLPPAEIAEMVGATCITCVDAAAYGVAIDPDDLRRL